MQNIMILIAMLVYTATVAQPSLSLWITNDNYHDHNHHDMEEYLCDSSYYIYYQNQPDSLFIAVKNNGNQPLLIDSIVMASFFGNTFDVLTFAVLRIDPGDMSLVKVDYDLGSIYHNGINGSITFYSNDPQKSTCLLNFDVGNVFPNWFFEPSDTFDGIPTSFMSPVAYVEGFNQNYPTSPKFYARDSFEFHLDSSGTGSVRWLEINSGTGINAPHHFSVGAPIKTFEADNGLVKITGPFEVQSMAMISDRRVKRGILPLSNTLDQIRKLLPRSYYLKYSPSAKRKNYGFIAQELETVLPSLVKTRDVESTSRKSIEYIQLIPILTAAIQEQQVLIEHMRKEINLLKKSLNK